MDIEKITKTQLINKLIEQHQRIKRLERRSEEEIDRIKSTLKEDMTNSKTSRRLTL